MSPTAAKNNKYRLQFGQVTYLDWHDQWPPAIWTAMRTIARRERIILPTDANDPLHLGAWLRLRPGYFDTIRQALRVVGYHLTWPPETANPAEGHV